MNIQEFQNKWRGVRLKERSAAQEPFFDLGQSACVHRDSICKVLADWVIDRSDTLHSDSDGVQPKLRERPHMEQVKETIRKTLADAKVYLSQDAPRKISEADTKANFIEPIVAALGWEGIGVVTREYYVKDSQEFIDYVMSGASGPLLAIEAKSLLVSLTDKNAAQLIQYCAVEGIEWAALTNGRELQFFNTFLKPDLAAKRILQLDLLAFNTDAEYDALFENLWQLSRESMTTSTGVRTWLHHRRLDKALREILATPTSSTVRHLRKVLLVSDVIATPQEISQWFRSHLGTASTFVPLPERSPVVQPHLPKDAKMPASNSYPHTGEQKDGVGQPDHIFDVLRNEIDGQRADTAWRKTKHYWAASSDGETFLAIKNRAGGLLMGLSLSQPQESTRLRPNQGEFNWSRISHLVEIYNASEVDDELLFLIDAARAHAAISTRSHSHYGVKLKDLVSAGMIAPGASLILTAGRRDIAEATLSDSGEIIWDGKAFASPSDKVFAALLGPNRISLNGWTHWVVADGIKRRPLRDLRSDYLRISE
jgi:hypothetical protein